MKRIISGIFCVIFILTLSFSGVGCKETAEEVTEEGTEEVVAEEVTEEVSEGEEMGPVELTFWTNLTVPAQSEVIQAQVEAYMAENPDVTVNFETVPFNDMYIRLLTAVESGNIPNIMNTTPDAISFAQVVDMIVPIDDLIDTIGRDDFFEGYLRAVSKDGKTWALPDWALHREIWYRTDVFEENGFTIPTTQKEMMEIAKALTKDTDNDGQIDVYGYVVPLNRQMNALQTFFQLFYASGGYVNDPVSGEYVFDDHHNLAVDTLEYLIELYECCSPPASIDWKWGDYRNAFAQGLSMMVQANGAVVSVIKETNPDIADNISAFVTPGKDGPAIATYEHGYYFAVGNGTEAEIKASIDLLEFMSGSELVADRVNSRPVFALPARESVFEGEYYRSNELVKEYWAEIEMAFYEIMPTVYEIGGEHHMTSLTGQITATTFFGDEVQAVALGKKSAEDAINAINSHFKHLKTVLGE